jgi:uncharacterized membrane protein YhaH (DUF805 family)
MDWYWYLVVLITGFLLSMFFASLLDSIFDPMMGMRDYDHNSFKKEMVMNLIVALLITILVFLFVEFKFVK